MEMIRSGDMAASIAEPATAPIRRYGESDMFYTKRARARRPLVFTFTLLNEISIPDVVHLVVDESIVRQ